MFEPVANAGEISATNDAGITRVSATESPTLSEPLSEENWTAWRERMRRVLRLCGIEEYADGKIPRPEDAQQARNWDFNDNYAQVIIVNNITSPEMVHVEQCKTARAMWTSLEVVHKSKGHQMAMAIIRHIFRARADDSSNISEHLTKLKGNWERLHLIADDDLKMSDGLFKAIISASLPPSWDAFTEAYVGGRTGIQETDPKMLLNVQQFIGILKEEYLRRQSRAQTTERPLASRMAISGNTPRNPCCKQCGRRNHATQYFFHLGRSKCEDCGLFGHVAKDCRVTKRRNEGNEQGSKKRGRFE